MAKPHKCPVCEGEGTLTVHNPSRQISGCTILHLTPTKCRACKGTGIVWENEEQEAQYGQ